MLCHQFGGDSESGLKPAGSGSNWRCNPEYSYDIQNRLVGVVVTRSGSRDILGNLDQSGERYYYTADNKRVSTARPNGNPGQAQVFHVYGAKGEIAAICTSYVFGDAPTCDAREPRNVKFAGRMIIQNYVPVAVDRLGSVVANPTQGSVGSALPKYYAPFGEQYNEAASGTVFPGNTNFGTYFHEETTGLNYADQRFYNSQYGRFMSADPYVASAGPEDPGSWNRYSFTHGDPVNRIDVNGKEDCLVGIGCPIGPSGCVIDPFLPVPDDVCVPVPPATPPPASRGSLKPIQCNILLFNQSVGFEGNVFQHTYIEAFISDPNTGTETNLYFEAGPSSIVAAALGVATLDKIKDVSKAAYPTSASPTFDFYKSSDLCNRSKRLATLFSRFDNGHIAYDGLNGPNSNSFTYTLLFDIGLTGDITIGPFTFLTLSAPGWGVFVKGL